MSSTKGDTDERQRDDIQTPNIITSFRQRGIRTLAIVVSSILIYGVFFDASCFLLLKNKCGTHKWQDYLLDNAVRTKENKKDSTLSSLPDRNATSRNNTLEEIGDNRNNSHNDQFLVDSIAAIKDEEVKEEFMQPLNISETNYYFCGYSFASEFVLNIFPEFREHQIEFHRGLLQNVSSVDFVAIDVNAPCPGVPRGFRRKLSWFQKNFQGTTIIVNGEFYGFRSWPRGFHLGYGPADNVTSMKLYSCANMLLTTKTWDLQQSIFDPAKKPLSTKERYLIYAQKSCVKYRDEAFDQLSRIDHAYHMGKCRGIRNKTISEEVLNGTGRSDFSDNHKIFRSYRFCLVMENHNLDGYISEKILAAFMGGCIPIYYGTPEIFLLFNKKAFIYYDIENPLPALDRVRFLNENNTAYDEVMAEPVLANRNETIKEFFSIRDDIEGGIFKKRIRQMIYNGRRQYVE